MKKKFRFWYFPAVFMGIALLTICCSRNSEPAVSADPVISHLTPQIGTPGTDVNITGTNFIADISKIKISFGATPATIVSASATQIRTKVPAGLSGSTVNVTVSINGNASNSATFAYLDLT